MAGEREREKREGKKYPAFPPAFPGRRRRLGGVFPSKQRMHFYLFLYGFYTFTFLGKETRFGAKDIDGDFDRHLIRVASGELEGNDPSTAHKRFHYIYKAKKVWGSFR